MTKTLVRNHPHPRLAHARQCETDEAIEAISSTKAAVLRQYGDQFDKIEIDFGMAVVGPRPREHHRRRRGLRGKPSR